MNEEDHQEDEILGKAYDARLMVRILRYLRPYWKLLAVSFTFLMLQTGTQLLGPYITKIAIDRYIATARCARPRLDGFGLSRRCRSSDLSCLFVQTYTTDLYRPARHARFAHGSFLPFAETRFEPISTAMPSDD